MFRTRILLLVLATALLPAMARAETGPTLEQALHRYVEAFDLAGVPDPARVRLAAIVVHESASHTAKMVAILDILQTHGALRHVDMHGEPPLHLSDLR